MQVMLLFNAKQVFSFMQQFAALFARSSEPVLNTVFGATVQANAAPPVPPFAQVPVSASQHSLSLAEHEAVSVAHFIPPLPALFLKPFFSVAQGYELQVALARQQLASFAGVESATSDPAGIFAAAFAWL